MAVLREQAGNVPIALGYPPAVNDAPLRRCLSLAEALGDRTFEVDVLRRLTVLSVSRLDFVTALGCVDRGLRAAALSGHGDARMRALDAAKTTYAYLGEVPELARVVAEFEPAVRRAGDLYLLQWVVFESALIPLSVGDHGGAVARIEAALAINRRSGYAALEPFYVANLAWVQRLAGDLTAGEATGARAVAMAREQRHDWWMSTAAAVHATTLLRLGRAHEAARLLESVRADLPADGSQGYRARCLAPLGRGHRLARDSRGRRRAAAWGTRAYRRGVAVRCRCLSQRGARVAQPCRAKSRPRGSRPVSCSGRARRLGRSGPARRRGWLTATRLQRGGRL